MDKIEGLLQKIKENRWFDNHGNLDKNVKLFDTFQDARRAVLNDTRDIIWRRVNKAEVHKLWYEIWDAVAGRLFHKTDQTTWEPVYKIATRYNENAAPLVSLYAQALTVLSDDDPDYQYLKKRADIWFAGYGVYGDVENTIYAYRKP